MSDSADDLAGRTPIKMRVRETIILRIVGKALVDISTPEAMGGGVAAGDIDGDGDIDLYFVSGDTQPNHLYLNDGNNRFTEAGAAWGLDIMHLSSGPAFADIDGDAIASLALVSWQEVDEPGLRIGAMCRIAHFQDRGHIPVCLA